MALRILIAGASGLSNIADPGGEAGSGKAVRAPGWNAGFPL